MGKIGESDLTWPLLSGSRCELTVKGGITAITTSQSGHKDGTREKTDLERALSCV